MFYSNSCNYFIVTDLVIKSLMNKDEMTDDCGVKLELEALTPTVKEIAVTFKKAVVGEQNAED